MRQPENRAEIDLYSAIGMIHRMICAMKDDRGRKLISCRQAAEDYGCSMRYIRKLAQDGRLTHEIVGGSYMVAADEVSRLKASTARGTGRHKPKASKFRPG